MFKDHKRTTALDREMRDDPTIAESDIVFTTALFRHEPLVDLPEISLVAAVFEDALRCVQRRSRGATPSQFSEAFQWIASDRHDWPFAFANVCAFLRLDAKAVRERLRIGDEGSDHEISH